MGRKILISALTVFLVLGVSGSVLAKSLNQLLPQMIEEHERLEAAEAREKVAKYRVREAEAGWYPTVDFTGDVAWEEVDRAGSSTAATHEIRNIQRFRATQLLYDFGMTNSLIDQNVALFEQSEYEKEFVRQTLIREGMSAYLNCVRYLRQLKYAIQSEENIVNQTGIEESLVERGAGLSSDVLQAKSSLAAAKARRVVVEGQLENAKARFNAIFGRQITDEEISEFSIPMVPVDEIPMTIEDAVFVALQENPQLLMLNKNIEVAREQIDVAESRYYPRFNLFGEYWRQENDGGNDGVEYETRAGAEVNWNIFNGGADIAAVKAAEWAKENAIFTLRDTHRNIGEQVRVSWTNLLTAQARAVWFSNQANIENEFLGLARKERKMGNRSLLDVLNAEVNYINALSGAIGAEVDKTIAAYNLLYAMGKLDLDSF